MGETQTNTFKPQTPIDIDWFKSIHKVLTKNQPYITVTTQDNKNTRLGLNHGKFKQHPNSPTTALGFLLEYCPPGKQLKK